MTIPTLPPVQNLRSKADQALGRRSVVQSRLVQLEQGIARSQANEERLDKVSALFKTLIDREITDGVQAVEKLLTEGVKAVFDDQDLWVTAEVEAKNGKVSVELVTSQRNDDGTIVQGVSSDAFGGAVTTVQSVLLRLSVMLRRGQRPLLLLDETLPAFDSNYVGNMAKFLQSLCSRMGVDVLIVSHNPLLVEAAHKAYTIRKDNGEATFHLSR